MNRLTIGLLVGAITSGVLYVGYQQTTNAYPALENSEQICELFNEENFDTLSDVEAALEARYIGKTNRKQVTNELRSCGFDSKHGKVITLEDRVQRQASKFIFKEKVEGFEPNNWFVIVRIDEDNNTDMVRLRLFLDGTNFADRNLPFRFENFLWSFDGEKAISSIIGPNPTIHDAHQLSLSLGTKANRSKLAYNDIRHPVTEIRHPGVTGPYEAVLAEFENQNEKDPETLYSIGYKYNEHLRPPNYMPNYIPDMNEFWILVWKFDSEMNFLGLEVVH